MAENRTAGGASMTSGVDTRVVPVSDPEALIAVKDSNVTTEISWIRQGDFDAARHYLLSAEEIAMVGQPRSKKWFDPVLDSTRHFTHNRMVLSVNA